MPSHKDILTRLLRFENESDLRTLIRALEPYQEATADELVTLTKDDLIFIFNRYLDEHISDKVVFAWADAIEQREDISFGYEGFDDEAVQEIIFKLATPELEGLLTSHKAQRLISVLSSSGPLTADMIADAYAEKD